MTSPSARRDGTDGAVRVARSVLLAATTLGFSAAAHTMAGGALPSTVGLVLLGSLTLVVTSVLGRWQLSAWTLVPVLLGLQSALHLGFQALGVPEDGTGPAAGGRDLPGHSAHHGELDLSAAAAAWSADPEVFTLGPSASAHTHGHVAMLLAHLGAVVAVTVLAVGADRALGRTVGRVVRLFLGPVRPLPVRVPLVRRAWTDADTMPRATLWSTPVRPRRGPPPVLGAV
ncbi:hypothetical protein ACNHYB_00720 [Isoptericola jiangsuensis]|uniref:hypothetical protein n=1 Tax=Isoptericola jiangsuensis TaxID=548579 RepID=UPI003AAF04D5